MLAPGSSPKLEHLKRYLYLKLGVFLGQIFLTELGSAQKIGLKDPEGHRHKSKLKQPKRKDFVQTDISKVVEVTVHIVSYISLIIFAIVIYIYIIILE